MADRQVQKSKFPITSNASEIAAAGGTLRSADARRARYKRFELELDALHTDFRQFAIDLGATNEARSRAGKDRIEGFKQALRDVREAAD